MTLHAVSAIATLAVLGAVAVCAVLLFDDATDSLAAWARRRRQHRADTYSGARWAQFTDAARKASRR